MTCKNCIHEVVCNKLCPNGLLPYQSSDYPAEIFCLEFKNQEDIKPVQHGEWIKISYTTLYKCSVCTHMTDMPYQKKLSNYCPNCGARMDGDNKSSPIWIQGSAEEVGSALKELYNNLSRCHKCVNEYRCSKTMDKEGKCPIYKRDPKDGGYYG